MGKFIRREAQAKAAGIPYVFISASRGYDDGETITLFDEDWSAEALEGAYATEVNGALVDNFAVSATVINTTWDQMAIDYCIGNIDEIRPCGVAPTDPVDITELRLSWTANSFDPVAVTTAADGDSSPNCVYFEIRRTDGTGPLWMCGEIAVNQRIV